MAGGSCTNDQINNDVNGLLAEDATQLRGLFDKESDIVDYASLVPPHRHHRRGPLLLLQLVAAGASNRGVFLLVGTPRG